MSVCLIMWIFALLDLPHVQLVVATDQIGLAILQETNVARE